MVRRAVRYKEQIFSDGLWHADALLEAERWFGELDHQLIEFGYIDEEYNWIPMPEED